MASAQSHPSSHGHTDTGGRTPAQWYATIIGATLVLVGILGFLANSEFNTGNGVDGDNLIVFEVNGIHNIVHLLSGLFLLSMAKKRATAKTAVLAFGVIYAIVTLIGLADGEDVLGLLPVNGADNALHILLTVLAFAAALISRGDDRAHDRTVG